MKAPIAVSIIAKDAQATIGKCLDSIVPWVEQVVVSVDKRTTDNTAKIARKHGAKVTTGLVVSETHSCPEHGEVVAQHFARARNAAFAELDPSIPWQMWVDADDVVVGAELLAEIIAGLPPDTDGLWLPYWYSLTPNGQPATQFDRERIVKASVGWHWQHRVHEVLLPNEGHTENKMWIRTDRVRVVHQDAGHDNVRSAKRNILLLEIEEEEGGNRSWCQQYLGNQWFALGEYARAVSHYRASYDTDNVYQRWVSYLYESMSWEHLGDLDQAAHAAWMALKLRPQHGEPYFRLAALSMLRGAVEDCETWTRIGRSMPDPPSFVFRNPMERPFNSHVTLGQAYYNAGEPAKALLEWQQAYKVVPSDSIKQGLAETEALVEGAREANAYLSVMSHWTPDEIRVFYEEGRLPQKLWQYGRLRDAVVPAVMRGRTGSSRIVFWCGKSLEPWSPASANTTGIGGSETAVVEIAKRFAADGWKVDVYNEPDKYEGVYDGVGYWGLNRLREGESADVLVSWRNASAHALPLSRRVSLLWCHDLNRGAVPTDDLAKWDRVLAVSEWHARYLSRLYGLGNCDYVPNGIDLERFLGSELRTITRVPFRVVYGSSPDRGLVTLLRLWPEIVELEPSAELHVAYGWKSFDKSIEMGAQYLVPMKQEILALLEKTPKVVWRDRLPQNELADLYRSASVWAYPTTFTEVSCITAMECMAAGCVPVTSAVGALPETIGDGGDVIGGNPLSPAWAEFYTACLRAVLQMPDIREPIRVRGLLRARGLSWDNAYLKWKEILQPAESRRELAEALV